jgi:hypothetical protein
MADHDRRLNLPRAPEVEWKRSHRTEANAREKIAKTHQFANDHKHMTKKWGLEMSYSHETDTADRRRRSTEDGFTCGNRSRVSYSFRCPRSCQSQAICHRTWARCRFMQIRVERESRRSGHTLFHPCRASSWPASTTALHSPLR